MTEHLQSSNSQPVTFSNVCKQFGDERVVDNLNLFVDNSELMVLLGPSGCGKTTSLRMLAGLESATSGEIRIGDTIVNQLPPRSRNIAMVFQSYALYSHLTVYNNLAYPLKVRKLKKPDIDRRVRGVAAQVQITELLDRKPREISGGQRQRVALGRAIIREPAVFLMDEPLSNLDAKLRLYMRGELRRFQRDLQTTTIYVTHDQAEAMTLADRVAIMDNGVLQQVGTPREVYRDPVNMFVAGFLGSPPMNFWQQAISNENGRPRVGSNDLGVDIRPDLKDAVMSSSSGMVTLGMRPEHLVVHRRESLGLLPAQILLVEDLGNEVLLDLRMDGHPMVARLPATDTLSDGDTVWLEFPLEHQFLFDPATSRRLDTAVETTAAPGRPKD